MDLHQTRTSLEREVYKARINVALDRAERAREYRKFKGDLLEGFITQISRVATEESINNLGLFAKADKRNIPMEIALASLVGSINEFLGLGSFLLWAGEQGGQAALDKAGIEAIFGLTNPEVKRFFDEHSRLLIKSVDDYTKKWIAGKIQEGYEKGLSPRDIAQTLIDEGRGIAKVRAERIALTELAGAMSKVETEASRRMGIIQRYWRTSRDELVCPICLPLNGVKANIDDDFDGYLIPAHPSCRCYYEDIIPAGWEIPDNLWLGS